MDDVLSAVQNLSHPDPAVHNKAQKVLVKIGAPAVPALIAALRRRDERGRTAIIRVLGQIGNPRAVKPLMDIVAKQDPVVAYGASQALARIGGEVVFTALLTALQDGRDHLRAYAAEALGFLGDVRAIPALIPLLADDACYDRDESVSQHAASALRALPADAVLSALHEVASQYPDSRVREAAARLLSRLER